MRNSLFLLTKKFKLLLLLQRTYITKVLKKHFSFGSWPKIHDRSDPGYKNYLKFTPFFWEGGEMKIF